MLLAAGVGLEILDLRHFASADLSPLLDAEIDFWGRSLSWDYKISADMILRYIDTKILPGYAAVERGQIFGYSFFVYEGSKGVIGDLFVSASSRVPDPRAVEIQLLTHVIETLQQSPGIHRIEAQLLIHETGAVAEPFMSQGFSRHSRLFMVLPLDSPDKNPADNGSNHTRPIAASPMRNADIEILRWTEQDYQPAAALITTSYRGHVDSEINDQYRSLAGSLRFLNNIVRFPGCGTFDPESSFVAVRKGSRNLFGLILCSRVRSDVGHVTQICVLPEYRSCGIGEALLAEAAAALKKNRCTLLSLTVTEANARAVELYQRLGFDIKKVFDAFVWEG